MVLGAGFLLLLHPSTRSLWIGGILACAGSMLRIWAAGHIEKGQAIAQSGPYRLTRNPLYLGSLVMAAGVIIAGQGYWLLVPLALFYGLIYYPVMKAEESELGTKFGAEFAAYCSQVPLFIPAFPKARGPKGSFSWSRTVRNGEHRTVGGLLLAFALLVMINNFWR